MEEQKKGLLEIAEKWEALEVKSRVMLTVLRSAGTIPQHILDLKKKDTRKRVHEKAQKELILALSRLAEIEKEQKALADEKAEKGATE